MRVRFVMWAAIAAVGVICAGSAPVAAQSRLRVKLATAAPKDTSYHRILMEMGEAWRKASGGQVDLVIYPGGNQGSEADTVRRMTIGELQAAMLTASGLSEIDPAISALESIPMLFRSLDEAQYVRDKLRPDLEKRLAAKGYVSLFWGDTGWARFFSRKAAVTPADFKPMKIFVTASGSEKQLQIMQALGYRPVPLDGVDAVPTIPIVALAGQYYTAAKHMTEVNWTPVVGATIVTAKAWDAVPAASREALLAAAADAGRKIQEQSRRENEQAVATMKTKWGVEVHPVSPQIDQEWRTFAEGIYPRIRGTMVPADMFDRTKQLVDEYRAQKK